jgi:hypothetical protein
MVLGDREEISKDQPTPKIEEETIKIRMSPKKQSILEKRNTQEIEDELDMLSNDSELNRLLNSPKKG